MLDNIGFWGYHKVRGKGIMEFQNNVTYSDGTEETRNFEAFPGVWVFSCKYNAYRCIDEREDNEFFQLNFCIDGRFECMFTEKECGILGAGDMAANLFDAKKGGYTVAEFPLGYYEGVGLLIDGKAAENEIGETKVKYESSDQ